VMEKTRRHDALACLAGAGLGWLSLLFMIHRAKSSIGRDQLKDLCTKPKVRTDGKRLGSVFIF
jgi:hypothetical protein